MDWLNQLASRVLNPAISSEATSVVETSCVMMEKTVIIHCPYSKLAALSQPRSGVLDHLQPLVVDVPGGIQSSGTTFAPVDPTSRLGS